MSNIFLGWPNRIDAATLSGGSWETDLPLTNLQSTEQALVARSTDDANASTKLNIDLGSARSLRACAVVNHNLSQSARWRISLGTTSGGTDLYAGAWQAAWYIPFDNDMIEWESDNWWQGTVDDDYIRHPYAAMIILPTFYEARYVTVEFDDTTNPDGYVQIGRLFVGGGFQPTYNAAYGLQDSWADLSGVEFSDSGAMFANSRRRRRSVSFTLQILSPDESAIIHEMQRRLGTLGEALYLPNPSDYADSQRYGFLGRLRELSAIEYPYYRIRSAPFAIEELL